MQEEYQKKLEQEVQRYISGNFNREGTDSLPAAREVKDKMISQRKALETVKQMLYQSRGRPFFSVTAQILFFSHFPF